MSSSSSASVPVSAAINRLGQRSTESWNPFSRQTRAKDTFSDTAVSKDSSEILPPVICFCHLSWDWVWQRPQQYLSRIAKRHRVLFVETYRSEVPATRINLRTAEGHPNVMVLQMHLPTSRWFDANFIDLERRRVLKNTLSTQLAGLFDRPILWFYDPMATVPFAKQLNERAIVYDCMDELSQFKGAPPELLEREKQLLLCADVVFCGGRKMRDKRLPLNPNCHFYGTGVDIAHFGSAMNASLAIPDDLAVLKGPVLGYFGVIDERIDYDLIAKLADARSDWHIVMVGPHAKVDPEHFPKRPNLHWIGSRPYSQLPAITKRFSVCLMPFALNAATEFINPTKALEYMAAGKPVVSTALDEVRTNFASVARVGRNAEEFIALCSREADSPSRSRVQRGLRLAEANTWDVIAGKMEAHIADALAAREAASQQAALARAASTATSLPPAHLAYV